MTHEIKMTQTVRTRYRRGRDSFKSGEPASRLGLKSEGTASLPGGRGRVQAFPGASSGPLVWAPLCPVRSCSRLCPSCLSVQGRRRRPG